MNTMKMFFQHFAKKLDKENKNWRSETVILLDNASYHNGREIQKLFSDLKIPIIYTGPHSYDAAPCELLFAAFKCKDINPRKIPTGKK